jgi:signal transduction histidine kinase
MATAGKETEQERVERERIRVLESYAILDTPAEKEFDDLTALASYICSTPVSLISLLTEDRQWFKSNIGFDRPETPRSISFCQHALSGEGLLEIKDTLQDERFRDNPLVTDNPSIRFYAGSPLVNAEGHTLGTLCVIDTVPKQLGEGQKKALDVLARQVVAHLELRLKKQQLEKEQQRLEEANQRLKQFVHIVSHDLKGPIQNLQALAQWLEEDLHSNNLEGLAQAIGFVKDRAAAMENLVNGLLQYSLTQVRGLPKEEVQVNEMLQELVATTHGADKFEVVLPPDPPTLQTEKILLQQVLANLIGNAVKYHHTGQGRLEIFATQHPTSVAFRVKDDGPGIASRNHEKIFGLFERLIRDTTVSGSGIGLATVRKIVEEKGGRIWVESALGQGATFCFTWPK